MPDSAKKQLPHLTSASFQGTDFDRIYSNVLKQNDWKTVTAPLNDKILTVKDGDVTYRVMNHWTSEGLFDDAREAPSKGWRKLSVKDVLWIRILRDLRRFGLPLEKLRVTHRSLFTKNGKPSSRDFELAILLCSTEPPHNFFIIIFDDGSAQITTLQNLWYNEAHNGYATPYIRISLNALVCEVLGSDRYSPEKVHPIVPSDEELDVIGTLREGGNDELRVIVKNGTVDRIDTSKAVSGAERIHDLLAATGFGEVTIQVENGKAVHTKRIKREKR